MVMPVAGRMRCAMMIAMLGAVSLDGRLCMAAVCVHRRLLPMHLAHGHGQRSQPLQGEANQHCQESGQSCQSGAHTAFCIGTTCQCKQLLN